MRDESYGAAVRVVTVPARGRSVVAMETSTAHGWHDVSVRAESLAYRYAGRVETGQWSVSDPAMGRG